MSGDARATHFIHMLSAKPSRDYTIEPSLYQKLICTNVWVWKQ